MAWALIDGSHHSVQYAALLHSEAERAGASVGTGSRIIFVLFVWVLGTIILGLMVMLTRGRRELITIERP